MPNKHDKAPYNWPSGQEEAWFASRLDTFPNGTSLRVYAPRLLTAQVKNSLDKVCDGKTKFEKK